jgi:hypothetical protein
LRISFNAALEPELPRAIARSLISPRDISGPLSILTLANYIGLQKVSYSRPKALIKLLHR